MLQALAGSLPTTSNMTSLPLVLDDEPMGIILKAGRQILRPAKIWAYCWFADEGENGDHTHRHLPIDPKV
ncbi:MAG TPA: hypothetical protein VFO67_02830 [Gemmatimonadales bacterium]|nr:hypothetical protein [Gemmatimonadales bacterium]